MTLTRESLPCQSAGIHDMWIYRPFTIHLPNLRLLYTVGAGCQQVFGDRHVGAVGIYTFGWDGALGCGETEMQWPSRESPLPPHLSIQCHDSRDVVSGPKGREVGLRPTGPSIHEGLKARGSAWFRPEGPSIHPHDSWSSIQEACQHCLWRTIFVLWALARDALIPRNCQNYDKFKV